MTLTRKPVSRNMQRARRHNNAVGPEVISNPAPPAGQNHELLEALALLQASEDRLRTALRASGEGIWDWASDRRQLHVEGLQISGQDFVWPENDVTKLLKLVHADDRDATSLAWNLHLSGVREEIDLAFRLRTAQGLRWLRLRGRALERDPQGRASRLAGTIKDITNQRHAEQSLQRMAHAFASTQDALAVVDLTGWIVEINRALEDLTGTSDNLLIGTPLSDYLALPAEAFDSASWRGELALHCGPAEVPVEVSVTQIDAINQRERCHIVAIHDLRERIKAASRLERMALQDALTGLPNRLALEKRIDELVTGQMRFALLFIDLDGFKGINDSFGHDEGDQILKEVARRFSSTLDSAVVARWGGDEFVIVLPGCSEITAIESAARLLIRAQAIPIKTRSNRELMISPSIGAVLFPRDGCDSAELFRKADAAMYLAKAKGRNRLQLFEPEIEEQVQRRIKLESQLRIDAERHGFDFYAQPKVDRNRRQSGAELLVRWTTADFGAVSPAEFIPMAEQSGAIDTLGRQALHVAATIGSALIDIGVPLPIAVNLSPRQLRNPSFVRSAVQACQAFNVPPSAIELELTESALAEGIDVVRPLLQTLRAHGFGLALDDFGTGYSSLSHLRELPFQKVKIDRSFVVDMIESPRARIMVESIVGLCRGLGLTTVAEGVESDAQFDLLRTMGVDEFQGYLFARPMPIDQWVDSLRRPDA